MHSQQVPFLEGKKDINDLSLEYTARRESFEEIGIKMSDGALVGELSEVYIPVSNFKVKPFVFFHEEYPTFHETNVRLILFFNIPREIDTQTKKNI